MSINNSLFVGDSIQTERSDVGIQAVQRSLSSQLNIIIPATFAPENEVTLFSWQ